MEKAIDKQQQQVKLYRREVVNSDCLQPSTTHGRGSVVVAGYLN